MDVCPGVCDCSEDGKVPPVTRVEYSYASGVALVGFQKIGPISARVAVLTHGSETEKMRQSSIVPGLDAAFQSPDGGHFLILEADGVTVTQYNSSTSTR